MPEQTKQINFTIVPGEDPQGTPPTRTYSNFCSIAHTPFDFTLTFCEVMPLSEKEIKEAESDHVVRAPARAKIVVPPQLIPNLIAALQENLRVFSESYDNKGWSKGARTRALKTPVDTRHILDALESQHPGADTELHYRDAFELLVATILSAQSTDQRVNLVTPALFTRYPDARSLAKAKTAELERLIHSTGFFRAKARSLVGTATLLVENHGGEVPADMQLLTALPGVGRKTANVVLGHALGVPGLPVDRHVLRVANRIGIADSEDPVIVEQQLCGALPKSRWIRASDTLILHGRRICKPKPLCDECAVRDACGYYQTGGVDQPKVRRTSTKPGSKRGSSSVRTGRR